MDWYVYIIESSDSSLYTGITKDIDRRFKEHAEKTKGAKFFRGRITVKVVYKEAGHTRSTATKREIEIKSLSKMEKIKLISNSLNLKC